MKDKIIKNAEKNGATFKDEIAERDYLDWRKENLSTAGVLMMGFFIAGLILGGFLGIDACSAVLP